MTEDATTAVELARPLDELREQPETIADAIERAARIDTLRDWLGELRDDVRNGYVDGTARVIEQSTGGSFNAPVKGVGTAYRTQPQPTPTIVDAEAFATWWVRALLDDDPDRDSSHTHAEDGTIVPPPTLVRYDDHVARRTVASCDSTALLAYLHAVAAADAHAPGNAEHHEQLTHATATLVDAIAVDVEWLVGEATLEALIKGDVHGIDDERPRVKVDKERQHVVDVASGELVPGVIVKPARDGVLTIKPDTGFKKRLRGELDELLGPPALRE